jgi:hypothetical protein
MQLVAYGAQDIYLTGNPMITYFKVVYRRHTNFAMESIEQTFSGNADFGQKVTALISRNGDLVSGLTLQATLPANAATSRWTENVGHYLINEVSIDIGGQQIDKHYGDWLEIWSQLSVPAGKQEGYKKMIGQSPRDPIGQPTGAQRLANVLTHQLFIPLQFWFCRNVGLALPLIALQYHEVKVNITFETMPKLSMTNAATAVRDATTTGLTDVALWADYIYLDTDERRRFAQVSHEYLIEQLQFSGDMTATAGTDTHKLNFNHPVKELIWVTRTALSDSGNQWCNYTTTQADNSGTEIGYLSDVFGAILDFTGGVAEDMFTSVAHGLTAGDTVTLVDIDNTTAEFVPGVTYFVLVTNANVFQLEATLGGGVIATTVDGSAVFKRATTGGVAHANGDNLASITTTHYFQTGGAVPGNTDANGNPTTSAILKLNGHERFASRNGVYFNLCQPEAHHSNTPVSPGINVYSFALKPEDHQPSGTCNFSRIDNAQLVLVSGIAGTTKIFATNYNVLRIMSGMGGLAYSN